ncbi:MAG TPA: ATP-binding cassette domain-containing protein [Solimonas sp.]|nr:ATP-binding cassette domain-containing protein [Solimonas sp.]
MLIGLKNLSLRVGSTVLLDDAQFSIEPRERVCLVGRNGAGKSTLFRVLSGTQASDQGEVVKASHVRLGSLAQEVPAGDKGNVYALVARGLGEIGDIVARYHDVLLHNPNDLSKLGKLQAQIDRLDGWAMEHRVQTIVSRLDLPAEADFESLSGGMKRRVLLAQALVSEPDLLLLDEPTNHLDIPSIALLEDVLLQYPGAILFISHDRAFVRRVATRICDLDRGKLTSWDGYDGWVKGKEEALHAEARQNALFDKRLAEEEAWIRKGVEARRTRSAGRVTRLLEMRRTYSARRNLEGDAKIVVQEAERSGKLVAELKGLSHDFAGQPIVRNLSTLIQRGDKIGIIGPNGAGKTTLLRLILGQLQPQQGEVRHGSKLEIGYFDQLRRLAEDRTAVEAIGDGREFLEIDGQRRHVITYLQDFLFTADRSRVPVRVLSGGERARLLLAQLFAKPSNVLVLDEPTNDLDMETLDLLEERLVEYSGTVLLVSHDREFLDNVVTRSLVFEGDGRVGDYVGGYADWLRQRTPPAEPARTPRATAKAAPEPAPVVIVPTPAPASRLNTRERRELDALPGRIEKLDAEQAALAAQISSPDFYARPREQQAAAEQRLADIEHELATAYARWEALEALK